MPVPSYRVPVKIARGTYANLLANVASLEEGEIAYANDENALYVVEGGVLTKSSADLGISSIGDLGDVDTTTAAPTDGQVLTWVNANGKWEPVDATGGGGATSIDDLTDVDTSTVAPTDGQALVWSATDSEWQPGTVSGGGGGAVDSVNGETGVVSLGIQDMDDFQLNQVPGLSILRYDTFSDGGSYALAGHAGSFTTNNSRFIGNQFDSNGVDAIAEQGSAITANGGTDVSLPVWFSADGVNWTAATSTFSNYPVDFRFNGLTKVSDGTPLNLITDITSSGPIYLTMSDPSAPPTPLADGDILQWSTGESLFKPAQPRTAAEVRTLLGIGEYADDATAGTGGVASGAMYYNTTSSDYRLKT